MATLSQQFILALDVGSSSIRAALYDVKGEPVPRMMATAKHQFEQTPDGGSEMDADACLKRVGEAIDALLKKAKRPKGEIAAVAISTFWHSLVGVDAKGKPTTKLLGWADTRSRDFSAVLKKRFDETETHDRTGAHFHSSFWPAKLMWLRKEAPDVFERTRSWLSFSDYLALSLFGSATTSISMASATGIFDQKKCDWDGELLRFLKVKRSELSDIAADGQKFTLTPKFARRWPRLANAKWHLAIGDGAADNIGSECVSKGKAVLMIGTSAAMRVAYKGDPPRKIPEGLWCYRIDSKRVIVGGALSDGGNLYAWLTDKFKLAKNVDNDVALRTSDDDLVVIPFFFGERSTGYNEDATGAIVGLTAVHDGVDILRAAMEGVAFRLADIFERLKKVTKISTIVASGGALRESPAWTQIIADVLGHDLTLSEAEESSSRGAVLLALESIGKIEDIVRK